LKNKEKPIQDLKNHIDNLNRVEIVENKLEQKEKKIRTLETGSDIASKIALLKKDGLKLDVKDAATTVCSHMI
jgi:hypothetical protein